MRLIFFFTAILLLSVNTNAAEVFLSDGSIVIGTLVSLTEGDDFIVDTEHMGEVAIEREAIKEIRSTKVIDVELFNGQRLRGQILVNEEGVTITDVDTSVVLRREQIFALSQVNESFWDGLTIYTDIGMNFVRGNNDVSQLNFGAGAGYFGPVFETAIDSTVVVNEQSESNDLRRKTLRGTYTYKFGSNWQLTGLLSFESDDQQGLNLRTLAGGAFGNRLVNNRRWRFDLYGGLVVNSEEFEEQSRTESLEGLVAATYRLRARSGIDIDASLGVLPNLEQSDRVRVTFDGSLSVDLINDLEAKLTIYNRYDSQPPLGNDKNDTGVTIGLSWEY
jgi:putative salt-induced outer membrane protein YdiY